MHLQHPGPDEYAPYHAPYVARVGEHDPLAALAAESEALGSLAGLSEADAAYRYAAGKWSIREVIGHLADAERIISYRALRVARGDQTPLASFDENAYMPAAGFERRSLTSVAAEFHAVRAATVSLFRGLPEEAYARSGTASGHPITVRGQLFVILGHERHHAAILRERYGLPR